MGLAARIIQTEAESKLKGQQVNDQPDGFLRIAVMHAQRSPHRFPTLARVNLEGLTAFGPEERAALKAEWLMMESLAVGKVERHKWDVLFQALLHEDTFKEVQFVAN